MDAGHQRVNGIAVLRFVAASHDGLDQPDTLMTELYRFGVDAVLAVPRGGQHALQSLAERFDVAEVDGPRAAFQAMGIAVYHVEQGALLSRRAALLHVDELRGHGGETLLGLQPEGLEQLLYQLFARHGPPPVPLCRPPTR